MEFKYVVILLLIFIGFVFIVDHYILHLTVKDNVKENFDSGGGAGGAGDAYGYVENKIIDLYNELLQRQPTALEIHNQSLDIVKNKLTLDSMREKIINSDEYGINMKMQSNSLVPEIHKMVADRALLDRIADIYNQEMNTIVPPKMLLPLKDLYIYFNYNEGALRALLRDPQYQNFETDVTTTPDLSNPRLIDTFNKYYIYDTIIASGNVINSQKVPVTDLSYNYGTAESMGVTLDHKNYRSINDTDTNSSGVINNIVNNPSLLNPDTAASTLNPPIQFYDSNGNIINLTLLSAPIILDARGNPIGTVYDAGGHIVPANAILPGSTVYDANGNAIKVDSNGLIKDSKGNPLGTIYDGNGNAISASTITTSTKVYDSNGKLLNVVPSSTTDKNGNPLGTVYDANGNIVPVSMIVAGMTVYDADGNQLTTSANLNELTDGTKPSGKGGCGKPMEYKRVMLPTHQGDMVLRPEMAWTVPGYNPPVCTTLGKPELIQPVFSSTNSSLLLGTPLVEAKNTAVGSILPKFTYKEYIDIPS